MEDITSLPNLQKPVQATWQNLGKIYLKPLNVFKENLP